MVAELKERIEIFRNGKNSSTSHTPPSQDIGRSNSKSLRGKSGLKPGGQRGHEGHTLKIKEVPDVVTDHVMEYCPACGEDLEGITSELVEWKQEVIIPPITPQYVEHRSHSRICKKCNNACIAPLPGHLKAPIQYGATVSALVAYLSVYQYLPYKRIAALVNNLLGLQLSEGTIDNMLEDVAQKALPMYDTIREKVQNSPVVGSDETGSHIAGKKGWFHTWQTTSLTFIAASMNRGYQTIERYYPKGFPQSVYVSDCWAAQLKVPALLHQLCIAHLLRELLSFEQALACEWSKNMKVLFYDALALKRKLLPTDYHHSNHEVFEINQRLQTLLNTEPTSNNQKLAAFFKRLNKNKDSIFTFLYHPKVPPDNNGSERAIRNIKVKTKVSGQFRTERGAHRFAVIRSVIDTTLKNAENVLTALYLICNFVPE